jgi:hypothetical protein
LNTNIIFATYIFLSPLLSMSASFLYFFILLVTCTELFCIRFYSLNQ